MLIERDGVALPQPDLVTGGTMRPYQLVGMHWLVGLYENGLNGILGDEMGLGKTIQSIALLAHLRQMNVKGPFMVVGPLSTLHNWHREFKKWAPKMDAMIYHGTKEERRAMVAQHFRRKSVKGEDTSAPVMITSYEIVIRDSKELKKLGWKFVVIDEGHRLKNMNCRLITELKAITGTGTATECNRLLLTGTPLQNNLPELWSLLNFLLGITQIDPLPFGLLGSRFLGRHRTSWPDIDSDAGDRDALIDAARVLFGEDAVIPVSNFNTLKLKSIVKDVAKFYQIDFAEVNRVTGPLQGEVEPFARDANTEKSVFVLKHDDCMKYSDNYRAFMEKYPHVEKHVSTLFMEQ